MTVTTLERPIAYKLQDDLCAVIAGGVNSPVRSCSAVLDVPMIVSHGEGDSIVDVDGNRYIDYCGSWGALIHGHAHPALVERIQKQATLGTSFGITCPLELQLAEQIVRLMPSMEQVRFVSSGTEATMSAARLARGFTGRDIIVKFSGNYHGHADFFLVQAGSGVMGLNPSSSSAGIPHSLVECTLSLPYNDSEAVRHVFADLRYKDKIAAVIVEPIAGNMGVIPATEEFMSTLCKETKAHGSLLIFDEVITGFRVALGGAQAYLGVTPDLTCLGKIMGGGLPAAAFGGRKQIMDHLAPLGKVYQAGTLSGSPLAMVAGHEALKRLEAPGVYQELERKTNVITEPVRALIHRKKINACLQQVGSMFTLFFGRTSVRNRDDALSLDSATFKQFFLHLLQRGIYIPPLQVEAAFVSLVHTEEHLEQTRDAILDFIISLDK